MHVSAACIPRSACALAAALSAAALAATGCGDSSSDSSSTTVERLAAPASSWADLSPEQQRAVVGLCRLDTAATVAQPSGSPPVARNREFAAVLGIATSHVRWRLGRRFRDPANARERIADGCHAVVRHVFDLRRIGSAPAVDFGPPMETTASGLRLTVRGDRTTLPARLTSRSGHATLRIAPTPGRARSTARVAIEQHGDRATVRLTHVPRGTSYLRAQVDGDDRRASYDIVVHGRSAPTVAEPRTFPPMRIHGDGSRGLIQFYLPQDGRATVTTEGAPLTLTSGGTVLLAHSTKGTANAPTVIPAGRYRDVAVRTSGTWSIRIVPAR